jgi:hypothetical protein
MLNLAPMICLTRQARHDTRPSTKRSDHQNEKFDAINETSFSSVLIQRVARGVHVALK